MNARLNRLGLRDLRLDEFETSPVDEIYRALTTKRVESWRRPKLLPNSDQLALEFSVDADFFRHLIYRVLRSKESELTEQFEQEPSHGQLGLPVTGDFSPSKKLTDIWIASLLALGKEADRMTTVPSEFEVAQEFSHTLSSLFGMIGQQLRYKKSADMAVTRHTRFLPSYQIQICDAFLIVPDQAATFLDVLRTEIHQGIFTGCQISGAWGKVTAVRGGDLHLALEPPSFVPAGDFEESEEIE